MKNWFQRMTRKAQDNYLREHPGSVYARGGSRRTASPIMLPARAELARTVDHDDDGESRAGQAGRWAANTAISVGLTSVGLGNADGARADRLPEAPRKQPAKTKPAPDRPDTSEQQPKAKPKPADQKARIAQSKARAKRKP